jgi:hypothetical protein
MRGRRGGKDRAASVLVTYLATLCDWSDVLAKGERGLVLCIGPDQRQATRNYIERCFDASPVMSSLIRGRTADTNRAELITTTEINLNVAGKLIEQLCRIGSAAELLPG